MVICCKKLFLIIYSLADYLQNIRLNTTLGFTGVISKNKKHYFFVLLFNKIVVRKFLIFFNLSANINNMFFASKLLILGQNIVVLIVTIRIYT